MKYQGKILITLSFLALLFMVNSPALLAQDSIEVRTGECYFVDPWYVGADTADNPSAAIPTWQTRYTPVLKFWVVNNQNKDDFLRKVIITSECSDNEDVGTVSVYRETTFAAGDPYDTTFGDPYYTASRRDKLLKTSNFGPDSRVTFDFIPGPPGPQDSIDYFLPANDSVLFYVVFIIPPGLPSNHTDNLVDAMIQTGDVRSYNGFTAPPSNVAQGRTYRLLVDALPPNLVPGNIKLDVDSMVVKMGVIYCDTVEDLTDNVTGALAQSTDDILVRVDLSVFGGSDHKAFSRVTATDDFTDGCDSIEHKDIPNGIDIEANEYMASGYIQKVDAWDEFGNTIAAEQKEYSKPIDTIWPEVEEADITFTLWYDWDGNGKAGLGDSIWIRADMRNQPPEYDPQEILNQDVYGHPNNGVYVGAAIDFSGFDPLGIHYPYPFYFTDNPADELWDLTYCVKPGDMDVPADDATSKITLTFEDNADYWPSYHIGHGNHRWLTSDAIPFEIDNDSLDIDVFTYDLDTDPGADIGCVNIVQVGDRIRIVADFYSDLDTIASVTVDLLTTGLGGPMDAALYDDGTHGDNTADDREYTLEWTIPYPMGPTWDGFNHYLVLTAIDDDGNVSQLQTYISSGRMVDTQIPYTPYNVIAQAQAGGVIYLDWDDSTSDIDVYYIYSNGGSGGSANIDWDTEVGHSSSSNWTSDPLTHGDTYCFGVRGKDNACNMDTNFWAVSCATADAEPPTADFINPLDGQTFCNFVQVVVQSTDADIDSFRIWFRQKDIDPGTAGDQPGPWTYGTTLDNDGEFGTGTWWVSLYLPDGVYEAVVCGIDLAGNEQDTTEAWNADQKVYVILDNTPPVVYIQTINDEAPTSVILNNGDNTICVYAVDNLADSMLVRMEIRENFFLKDTVDQGWVHKDDISPTNPFCFDFSLANWQADSVRLKVLVWDVSLFCWRGVAEIYRPVQDIFPVVATMTSPVNYQRVFGSEYFPVQAEFLAGSPVDEVTLVQFQERPHGGDTWTTFASVYSHFGNYFNAFWNNLGYEHNAQVDLRALFYDDAIPANVETTAFVTVTVDKEGPGIELVIENAQVLDDTKYVGGDSLFLSAKVLDYVGVDIRFVNFYAKKTTEPDIYYQYIGSGNMENNYTIFHLRKYIAYWDTAYYHVKAIGWDASWQDSASQVDSFFYKGNYSAPQVAINKVRTDTMEWINPSKYLRYTQTQMDVYVQAWKQVTCWHLITTPGDSVYVDNIAYSWDGFNLGNYGLNDSVTFNPLEDGIINLNDLEGSGGSYYARIHADLTDIFGNTTQDHSVGLYVLDVTGNQVVVLNPDNNEYKRDEIWLGAAAINGYNLRSVTYWYRPLGETEWIKIATVTGSSPWSYTWLTRNNVPDGWYEIMATSEDLAGNISEPGPFQKFFIGNTPPVCWMVSPEDSAFLGPNLDIRPGGLFFEDFDTMISVYARPVNPGGCPIDEVWFGYKPITSQNWNWLFLEDDLTYFADSLYGRVWDIRTSGPGSVTNGWYHVAAEAVDSCGNWVWSSDTMSVYMDLQEPCGEVIGVNDMHTPANMDLGALPYEDTLKARAWDPTEDGGGTKHHKFASGLDSLQFMVYKGSCFGSMLNPDDMVFFGAIYEPNDSAQYEMIWNSEGADTGDYCFCIQAVDKVRNRYKSLGTALRIEDHTQRIATVRAFHNYSNRVYASVNMPGATSVTFQYFSLERSEWVNFGLAEAVNSWTWYWGGHCYETDTLWFTPWDPTSLLAGDYLVRCLAHGPWEDGYMGPRKPGLAKPMDASVGPVTRIHVDADGNVTTAATEDIGAMSFETIGGISPYKSRNGVVKVQADAMPYLFVVYADLDSVVKGVRRIPVYKETGFDSYNSTFKIPSGINYGGTARFYASVTPDTNWIEMGGFEISLVTKYLGTNGPVWFTDGTALIDFPGHAIHEDSLSLVGYLTPMPPVVSNECKRFTAIGNGNGLLWRWLLFDYGDYDLNDYVKITLYYDHTQVTVPESQLQVARWHYRDLCWDFSNVESPVVDEANHSITFWTNRLGTYAVVQTEIPIWASLTVDPYCGDYSNDMPCFIAYIHSEYADIDVNSIKMKLGPVGGTMKTIYYDDHFADGYCSPFAEWYYTESYHWECHGTAWDPISGELDVCIMNEIKALAAGDYALFVEAYDQVGNYVSAVDTFTVDADPPVIYMTDTYVGSDPEFYFVAKDAESGLEHNSIFVDLYSVTKQVGVSDTTTYVELQAFLGTYTVPQLEVADDTIFWVKPTLELVDAQALDVVIHDGYCNDYRGDRPDYYEEGICIPPSGYGPADCVGNSANHIYQRFVVDAEGPTVTATSMDARPIVFTIEDDAGVDWPTFMLLEDGTDVTDDEDKVVVDQEAGTVKYTPTDIGVGINIAVKDKLGNKSTPTFTTEAKVLAITGAHNYPNPFDQSTTIVFTLSRGADVVVKIYDFSGELVKTVVPGDYMNAGHHTKTWHGANEDGDGVANGIYLCHIQAHDGSHTASEVIKIAVVRKD
jgi:hypothetical protein